MTPDIRLETRVGAAIIPLLPDLARLRATVFRDWPYLYDGNPAAGYEAGYASTYTNCDQAAAIFAFAGDAAVGVATCLPLGAEPDAVQAPFRARGWDPGRFFYFGESVLLPAWRGRGVGVGFFAAREAHARAASDADYACFCSVIRPADHPARPPGAVPLDAFWRRRGYQPLPDVVCTMRWKVVGDAEPTEHRLAFWAKSLRGAPLPVPEP